MKFCIFLSSMFFAAERKVCDLHVGKIQNEGFINMKT